MLSPELTEMLNDLVVLWDLAYEQIKPMVDYIIKNNIRDSQRIDLYLEKILDIPTEKCYQLYLKLCAYYATFNYESAKEYLALYEELYGEDDDKDDELTRKKTK